MLIDFEFNTFIAFFCCIFNTLYDVKAFHGKFVLLHLYFAFHFTSVFKNLIFISPLILFSWQTKYVEKILKLNAFEGSLCLILH